MTNEYTTIAPTNIMPGSLSFPSGMISEYQDNSSRANIWPSIYIEFPKISVPSTSKTSGKGFIGVLTDEEAKDMKTGINLFKKRFDDDLAKRNQILFGE